MGAEGFGSFLATMVIIIILVLIFKTPIQLLAGLFTGVSEHSVVNDSKMQRYKYRGFATLVGGNHPLLGSESKRVVIAIKNNKLFILNKEGSIITKNSIKNVKAEIVTASAATAANIFLFGLMSFGAKEKLLQLEVYDENSKETYKSLFKDTAFNPDWINQERYNFLVQENSSQSI